MKDNKKQSNAKLLARSESAVRDREERLRAILETAVEGIITIDERGNIESFNRASETILAIRPLKLSAKTSACSWPRRTRAARRLPHKLPAHRPRQDHRHRTRDLCAQKRRHLVPDGFVRQRGEVERPADIHRFRPRHHGAQAAGKRNLEISEREQRRIGQDLHDGLCQHLAGVEMLAQVLAQKLAKKSQNGSARAVEIAKAVRESISQTRLLARGLSPVTLESEGLMSALAELALNTEKIFRVRCTFDCPVVVKFDDHAAATHLFRIAQEAVSNAIKHGKAKNLSIQLREDASHLRLRVNDDGVGFLENFSTSSGMGLRIMQSRIGMVGGTVTIERQPAGGTSVIFIAPKIR